MTSSPAGSQVLTTPVEDALSTSRSPEGPAPSAEQALARPDDHREDPQAVLVDEVVTQQRLDQVRAAVHLRLRPILGLEGREGVGGVALEQHPSCSTPQVGTAPRRPCLVASLNTPWPPRRQSAEGHDVVGPASQHHGERPAGGLAYDLAHVVVPVVHRPAAVGEPAVVVLPGPPGACMAVGGHEGLHDQLPRHLCPPIGSPAQRD